jgi:hypothetical protein
MTEQEIRALLIAAMAYDNRKPGNATVAAWLEAAQRSRWTFDAALDALHAHYAESADWVMPGHITARLRTARTGPAPVGELLALPVGEPAQPERIDSIVDAVAARLGWQRTPTTPDPGLGQRCPHCHAAPGRPCTRVIARGGRRGQYVPIGRPHPSRRGPT